MFTIYVLAASGERFNETKTCCCLSHRRSRCSRSNPHFYVLCGQRSLIKCSELTIPGRRGEDFPSTNYVYNKSTEIYWGQAIKVYAHIGKEGCFFSREGRSVEFGRAYTTTPQLIKSGVGGGVSVFSCDSNQSVRLLIGEINIILPLVYILDQQSSIRFSDYSYRQVSRPRSTREQSLAEIYIWITQNYHVACVVILIATEWASLWNNLVTRKGTQARLSSVK